MSSDTGENKRGQLEIPRLEGEALKWVETVLSIGMPYKNAVWAFLDSFPQYGEHETLTEDEIFKTLSARFKRMRRDTRRVSYQNIKETQNSLKKLLDCLPVASPLTRLIELEKLRQDSSLKVEQLLKVLGAAAREVELLMPRERTSPFSGLPDLISRQTEPETDKDSSETPQKDPFGGAMMQHANTRKETSENG